ncbi:hypothetical protein INR49_028656 [Caranx melampygus]|nr:hypothetical protein INR49_028656 [Caranx melampygus]
MAASPALYVLNTKPPRSSAVGSCVEEEKKKKEEKEEGGGDISEAPSPEDLLIRTQKMSTCQIETTGPPSYLTHL